MVLNNVTKPLYSVPGEFYINQRARSKSINSGRSTPNRSGLKKMRVRRAISPGVRRS